MAAASERPRSPPPPPPLPVGQARVSTWRVRNLGGPRSCAGGPPRSRSPPARGRPAALSAPFRPLPKLGWKRLLAPSRVEALKRVDYRLPLRLTVKRRHSVHRRKLHCSSYSSGITSSAQHQCVAYVKPLRNSEVLLPRGVKFSRFQWGVEQQNAAGSNLDFVSSVRPELMSITSLSYFLGV